MHVLIRARVDVLARGSWPFKCAPWRLPATGIGEMNCSRFPGGGGFDIRIEFGEEFV